MQETHSKFANLFTAVKAAIRVSLIACLALLVHSAAPLASVTGGGDQPQLPGNLRSKTWRVSW